MALLLRVALKKEMRKKLCAIIRVKNRDFPKLMLESLPLNVLLDGSDPKIGFSWDRNQGKWNSSHKWEHKSEGKSQLVIQTTVHLVTSILLCD